MTGHLSPDWQPKVESATVEDDLQTKRTRVLVVFRSPRSLHLICTWDPNALLCQPEGGTFSQVCSDVSLGPRAPAPRSEHVSQRNTPGLEGLGEPVTWVSTPERSFALRWFDDPCGLVSPGGEDARPWLGESTRDKPECFEVQPWKYVGCYGSKQWNQPASHYLGVFGGGLSARPLHHWIFT